MVRTLTVYALLENGVLSLMDTDGMVHTMVPWQIAPALRGALQVDDVVRVEYRVTGGRGWTSSGIWHIVEKIS